MAKQQPLQRATSQTSEVRALQDIIIGLETKLKELQKKEDTIEFNHTADTLFDSVQDMSNIFMESRDYIISVIRASSGMKKSEMLQVLYKECRENSGMSLYLSYLALKGAI